MPFPVLLWLLLPRLGAQNDPLLAWLDRIAQRQLDTRERTIAAIQTTAAADQRREQVRTKLLDLLGGLPDYTGPLNARRTGEIAASGYTIEKIYFESLPRLYITANVYRPVNATRHPGVLIPAGHTQEGKPEAQVLAANLARQGYVALTYDPIGQGEREQSYLPQLGRELAGGGGNEHLELGARSILLGQSVARYFIHDARRALDYLASRPDVDPERLGVTGCSGGGCITTYLAAFDPRIKAAAPGCYINSFRKLFPGPTADSEMSLPQFLASGLDLADFIELPAPRMPWLLMATTGDYFTPAGAEPVYREAKHFYDLYGAGDRVRFFVGDGPHGTPRESREAIYAWMARWLKGINAAPADEPVKQYTDRELRVTLGGNVDELPGSRKVYQVIADEAALRLQPKSVEELRRELRRLGVPSTANPPSVRTLETVNADGFRIEQLAFDSEPGIELSARLYLPNKAGRAPATLVVEERRLPVPLFVQRSQSTAAVCEALVRAGHVVLELSPRDSPSADEGRPFLGNWVTNERADLVGRNLPALRAHDILRGVDLLAARADVETKAIRGYARGVKGFWLLLAAVMDPRMAGLWLDRMPVSFRSVFDQPLTTHLFDALIPGFVRHWDMSTLLEEVRKNRRILRSDPVNWMNRVVEADGADVRYRYVGEPLDGLLAEFNR